MADAGMGIAGVALTLIGGAMRLSTPYLFVALGETITERSGRINLGLEGTLMMGAACGYGASYLSGSPWLGVLAAGAAGILLGAFHSWLCSKPRVNDVAVGISMMLFGTGLAFYLGKPLIQPKAPQLSSFEFGSFSDIPTVRDALSINPLFVLGAVLAPATYWALFNTRWGMVLRTAGESSDAARALGYSVNVVRLLATALGGFFAGIAGAFLSLSYPGIWSEGLSSGQGLIAVALVIFARWNPVNCLYASLLYGAASSLSPALQSIQVDVSPHLLNTAPALLTLVILVWTSHPNRTMAGAPAELGVN